MEIDYKTLKNFCSELVKDKQSITNLDDLIRSFFKIQPIFISDDGVKYYEGEDMVWHVNNLENNDRIVTNPTFIGQTPVKYAININSDKFFSTSKAAMNYIKCNMKCLSFNDVWNMTNNKSTNETYIVLGKNTLTNFVKKQINILYK